MKTLILVRHAKSSWGDFTLPDFDRPLNERGKHDAPMMAKRLLEKGVKIDALVSSPAKRAKRTAQAFADVLGKNKDQIIFFEKLYMAGGEDFFNVIDQLDESIKNAAIFSHNPGITVFANMLQVAVIDEMPTCSIFAITTSAEKWSDFRKAKKELWFFDFPKNNV